MIISKPGNTLGALYVMDMITMKYFHIGTGFDNELRNKIWNERDKYRGKLVKYKYQATRSKKDKPISPVFLGFRDERDL